MLNSINIIIAAAAIGYKDAKLTPSFSLISDRLRGDIVVPAGLGESTFPNTTVIHNAWVSLHHPRREQAIPSQAYALLRAIN
jgi:hypothetical protein